MNRRAPHAEPTEAQRAALTRPRLTFESSHAVAAPQQQPPQLMQQWQPPPGPPPLPLQQQSLLFDGHVAGGGADTWLGGSFASPSPYASTEADAGSALEWRPSAFPG